MAKSRRFDLIGVAAVICALVITLLFMNGAALGITPVETEDNASGYFTDNDLRDDWETDSATFITLTGDGGSVQGNGAYIYDGNVYIIYAGYYVISGQLDDGTVIVDADGDDKVWIQLAGVSLSCSDGAAFAVENADKVFLTLADGSTNSISDGENYSEENIEDGITGALYSRDDLTINGSGSLTVTGNYKHGIVAHDDMVFTGGNITITAKEDAIHANDSVRITEADITIDARDDGITVSNDEATDYLYVESGSITINSCYEGLESNEVLIAGGSVLIYSSDDGINATGTEASDGIVITGGEITVINTTGMDADGFDSNTSILISGGSVFVSVPSDGVSTALDYGSELVIDGGTVIAAGGSGMMEEVSSESAQGFVVYSGDDLEADSAITLMDEAGEVLISTQLPAAAGALILSTADMTNGETYTLTAGDTETVLTAGENSASFGGFGGFSGFGGGGGFSGDGGFSGGGGFGGFPQPDGTAVSPGEDASEDTSDETENSAEDTAADTDDRQMPEGMTPPDGAQMPDGMTPPDDAEMPDGMTPPDGAEMPDGMTPPDDAEMPDFEDMTEIEDGSEGTQRFQSPPNGGGPGGSMPGFGDTASAVEETITVTNATWIWIGVSVCVLMMGLIFAFFKKGKQ